MLLNLFPLALIASVLLSSGLAAQEQGTVFPVPELAACRSSAHPRTPQKWRATYLMAPFSKGQLVLGDIEHDGETAATRVKLYGVQHGSADLLVMGKNTYQVTSQGGETRCEDLGDSGWRPFAEDWLTSQSRCTGSAPLGDVAVDWWKTPVEPAPASYRLWYDRSDQPPFRVAFQFAVDRPAVLGRFALSYRVGFAPQAATGLSTVAAACRRAKRLGNNRAGPRALDALIEAMAQSPDRADEASQQLMPALSASCPAVPFPTWPEKLAITGMMTPYDFHENPYPTEVLYDWSVPAQRSRILMQPQTGVAAQDSLLLGPAGYTVTYGRQGGSMCQQVLPGTIRPDWASRGDCQCAGTINGQSPLTPYGTTRILVCPLGTPRVAWSFYALSGRPTVFMVTSMRGDQGFGLFAVLDYREWLAHSEFPGSVFGKPAQCQAPPRGSKRGSGVLSGPGRPPGSPRCDSCHLGSAPER